MKLANLFDLRHSLDFFGTRVKQPRFALNEGEAIVQHIQEHGWVMIRSVFSKDEIEEMRLKVERTHAEGIKGDLLSNPYLNTQTVLNEKILSIVSGILPQKPVFFGDSSHAASYGKGGIGFHQDNPDKEDASKPDWQTPYTIIRVGVYLQDYSQSSGGLGFRDRSHRTNDVFVGTPVLAKSQLGDVLVWYHTTTHSGFMSRPRVFPNLYLPLALLSRICVKDDQYSPPRWLFRPHPEGKRAALLFSYGIRDNHLSRYLDYLMTRKFSIESWRHSFYNDIIRKKCENSGLELIDMRVAAQSVDSSILSQFHDPNWEQRYELNTILSGCIE